MFSIQIKLYFSVRYSFFICIPKKKYLLSKWSKLKCSCFNLKLTEYLQLISYFIKPSLNQIRFCDKKTCLTWHWTHNTCCFAKYISNSWPYTIIFFFHFFHLRKIATPHNLSRVPINKVYTRSVSRFNFAIDQPIVRHLSPCSWDLAVVYFMYLLPIRLEVDFSNCD